MGEATASPAPAANPVGDPYQWDRTVQVAPEVLKLWKEVANGIDKSQTVVWKNAVESLASGDQYLTSTEDARRFIEKYMKQIIGILVEQQPAKIGQHERSCVEESLGLAVRIVAKDLKIQSKRDGESSLLEVLSLVFNRKKAYYKGSKANWNVNSMSGLPEIRIKMIDKFRQEGGFAMLANYLKARIATPMFPPLEFLHQILAALADGIVPRAQQANIENQNTLQEMEEASIMVSGAIMDYIRSFTEESLRKHQPEMITTVRVFLQRIFDRLIATRRKETYEFYVFWRSLILKLISSESLPLRLTGWEQMKDIIEASQEQRPPPKMFIVEGAGTAFVNGLYAFSSAKTEDGYMQRGAELTYKRSVPSAKDGKEVVLTLFRCTMRSQQKWWFLSDADEEQPGTDRDIDYYQHKSKEHDEVEPPATGWTTCRNAGQDPPPTLRARGIQVPKGEEYNTLEHQLARWAIENKIVELVLGASLHREVVARSTSLIEFLASMCERDEPSLNQSADGQQGPNACCLQTSHLLLAWKTCTSKADAAVSEEIYQLLVSILPSLNNSLAVPLLQAIHASLSDKKKDSLFEVAEFCAALSNMTTVDAKGSQSAITNDDVRAEILRLLWGVLTHPDASSLKNDEVLKQYVANELKMEPNGQVHREKFLESCTEALSVYAKKTGSAAVDEVLSLRIVKLTHFVLDACPRPQTTQIVTSNHGGLASLIFNELTAFLDRRRSLMKSTQKRGSMASVDGRIDMGLNERLKILRYIYGVSEEVKLSFVQLQHLWRICSTSNDREEVMVFVARSSMAQASATRLPAMAESSIAQPSVVEPGLSVAFSEDVRTSAFLELFCSKTMVWNDFGEQAYESFQIMFKAVRQSPGTSLASNAPSMDALWRICLTAGNENVVALAMKDLLSVYAAMASVIKSSQNSFASPSDGNEPMQTNDTDEDFGQRVFECLKDVKKGLDAGDVSSERSAERCLRILNAAVGQDGTSGRSITSSTVASLLSLPPSASLSEVLRLLPHGMRGQACYRRIGVMAKRTNAGQHSQDGNNRTQMRFPLDVHPLETLGSVKAKVAAYCQCRVSSVKPISANGRQTIARTGNVAEPSQTSLTVVPDEWTIDQLGIVQGCEMVFVIAERQMQSSNPAVANKSTRRNNVLDLGEIFSDPRNDFANKLFKMLLSVLEALPWKESENTTHKLVWDLLLAMPTNANVADRVRSTAGGVKSKSSNGDDAMSVDRASGWDSLINKSNFQRSVYYMQAIDAFLQPAAEVLSILPSQKMPDFEKALKTGSSSFRKGFVESGGFDSVVRFFSSSGATLANQRRHRMANAAALRILKCCLFGNSRISGEQGSGQLDETGSRLLDTISNTTGLLQQITAMVVGDDGVTSTAVSDVLKLLRLLFRSSGTTETFVKLPDRMAQKFVVALLLWEGGNEPARTAMTSSMKVRKTMHDLVLSIPLLARYAMPWLISAVAEVDANSDATSEFFDVLQRLVCFEETEEYRKDASSVRPSPAELQSLGTAVCKKLLSCPRPMNGPIAEVSTGVLCGCLKLLRALVENGGGKVLSPGTTLLVKDLKVSRWSEMNSKGVLGMFSRSDDSVLVDLMGALFDGFLSPQGSASVSICCDKESRQHGFDAVAAAARSCRGSEGYMALVDRVNGIMTAAAPGIRHKWSQLGGSDDGHSRSSVRNPSKYSGLRNQGCTCYMNSFLQQLFMMPELRGEMCEAPLPAPLRTSGSAMSAKGQELVGKKVALQWDTGVSYDAMVEKFNPITGMHTVRYCPLQIATVGGAQQHVQPDDVAKMPEELPEEFILSEGRPGKETGVFEVVKPSGAGESTGEGDPMESEEEKKIEETEEESAARHLLEEVQRTFIHLDEGSRGRCFDPRAFVEACACLKLEFDVWQQNDASEFAMKLLDRMEIPLKRWAPKQLRHLDNTFGLKQTKQKICKKCGLKTNREENLMSIDCQIRGKSDIHEALETMCEVEYMEGNNKVFCDRCKENTDTVLKTAISALPDVLILSLKRFDLDYNTFETVKLNSRLAFGQTLNMKRYTLEGIDAAERARAADSPDGPVPMETDEDGDEQMAVDEAPDLDYEYKLVGVLVHAGVAQGGHYYSFIKDRSKNADGVEDDKWYRFDDEDVTPFDSASIESECFGGKVKKETKWPNGQVHTVESEQFANALMLFYEKVTPAQRTEPQPKKEEKKKKTEEKEKAAALAARAESDKQVPKTSGYDAFEPDVKKSNQTHKWQTFLFDSEFQSFLRGLLGLSLANRKDTTESTSIPSWHGVIVDMLLTFFFDVYLYSADKGSSQVWVKMLSETLVTDPSCARQLVHKIAIKTEAVSDNWLRTYLADCPEVDARVGAVKVFGSAILSCLGIEQEQALLSRWAVAARDQYSSLRSQIGKVAFPTSLVDKFKSCEDITLLAKGDSSAIGIIISFITTLIEAGPRTWKYNEEIACLVRDVCNSTDAGGALIRSAMNEAQVPARLIALMLREKSPVALRVAFPGASVAHEVAETQVRTETNPHAHLLPLGGTQMMDTNKGPSAENYLSLLEAVGRIVGVKSIILRDLILAGPDTPRGRPTFILSEDARDALTTIYNESKGSNPAGMGQRDIDHYLRGCNVDSGTIPTQKIVEIMSKYPAVDPNGQKVPNVLSLDGFLAYYKEIAQTQTHRVRSDLHAFGFRPDLTRRSHDARILTVNGKDELRSTVESVGIDVAALMAKDGKQSMNELTLLGLNSFELYSTAHMASPELTDYLLASTAFERDTKLLLISSLRSLRRARNGWQGNHQITTAMIILRSLVSIPDGFQSERISLVMQSGDNSALPADQGDGLLRVAKAVFEARQTPNYNNNEIQFMYDRYLDVIKDLGKLRPINLWLTENRPAWIWMERDLIQMEEASRQSRSDYGVRRDGGYDNPRSSDTDMNGIQDSDDDDDDEDSRLYDDPRRFHERIVIQGAGLDVVNGVYTRDGLFDGAGKYVKSGTWNGVQDIFVLFRCNVSNNTKHWYISIVPAHIQPGTNKDIDFYSAPVSQTHPDIPPTRGWMKANEGTAPPPTLVVQDDENEVDSRGWNRNSNSGGRYI